MRELLEKGRDDLFGGAASSAAAAAAGLRLGLLFLGLHSDVRLPKQFIVGFERLRLFLFGLLGSGPEARLQSFHFNFAVLTVRVFFLGILF